MSSYTPPFEMRQMTESERVLAERDGLLSAGQWYVGMFVGAALLQVFATIAALAQPDLTLRIAAPAVTGVFVLYWFWMWYLTASEFRYLRGSLQNIGMEGKGPFWLGRQSVIYTAIIYLQACTVVALIAWRMPSETVLAVLSAIGPLLAWPAAVVVAALLLRENTPKNVLDQRGTSHQMIMGDMVGMGGDVVGDRVKTLEIRADNARLPEPDEGGDLPGQVGPEQMRMLIDSVPRAAVLIAWAELEQEVSRFAGLAGLAAEKGIGRHNSVQSVLSTAAIPESVRALLDDLRMIRNNAAHKSDELTSSAAEEYVRLAKRLLAWFRQTIVSSEPESLGKPAWAKGRVFSITFDALAGPDFKIGVIRVVRELTEWGLADAKRAVESPPTELRSGLSWVEAHLWHQRLESAGARASVAESARPAPQTA